VERSAGDSGKKAGHWGEHGISRKPLRGECPGDPGVTVVTMLVRFFVACEAAGASSARHSLRPLISEGGMFGTKLAQTRGEIAKLCRYGRDKNKFVMAGLDPAIHRLSEKDRSPGQAR